jgi:hypothetical protein
MSGRIYGSQWVRGVREGWSDPAGPSLSG